MAHLLLLHELRVGTVIDDILAEHGSREGRVDLLGIDILDLSVEDKVVASSVEADRHLATEEDKGEDWAILLVVGEEEGIRIHAIPDGVADNRHPVEDERRLIGVLEQELLEDIEDNGQEDKGGEAGSDNDGRGRV